MKLLKVKLDELGKIGRGKSKHRPRNDESLYGGDFPFVQTGDVKAANFYLNEYSQTYNEKGLAQSKLWKKGTLLITIAANIGDTAILDIDACFPDSIAGFQSYENVSDIRYVKYYLDYIQLELKAISAGATQDNMSLEKLLSRNLFVPEFPIQQKIASILSSYDELIENNKQRISLLEEMAEEIYKEWFVRLRFPGYENTKIVDGLPEGWEEKEFQFFGEIVTGKTPSTFNNEFYNGSIPFVKTPDIHEYPYVISTNETLSNLGAKSQKNKFIPKNSLIVSCIGSAGSYALSSKDCQTNQQINSIVFYRVEYTFYFYCFANDLKPLLDNLGSNGATMTNVNKSKFERIKIILPKEKILIAFHNLVKNNFELILNLQEKNQLLQETRDLLLPRLISGKLSVDHLVEKEELMMVAEERAEYKKTK